MINIKKIGMRNIKTSLSVFSCMIIYILIGNRDPFYACIACVMCMQSTLDNTKRVALDRMIGTFIGGIAGIIILSFEKSFFLDKYTYILISIGIIPLIYICNLVNRGSSVPISCVVFITILLYHRESNNPYIYAINRVIDTGVGIIITMLINRYIKRPKFMIKNENKS